MKLPIYLDNHATTPVDPRVFERMQPFFCEEFGNASSRSHAYGWKAEAAVEAARAEIADQLGVLPQEIVFTSGATEANNLAIFGVLKDRTCSDVHIISQVTEHPSVIDCLNFLKKNGAGVTLLPVDGFGLVDPENVAKAILPNTVLVSIMLANNEIGTIQPIEAIGDICHKAKVFFHCDASQGFGKIPFDVNKMQVDLASLSAHKLYGPKGVGALFVRRKNPKVLLEPQIYGGGHERGLRSGTLNVPGIVGLGEAVRLVKGEFQELEELKVKELRDSLQSNIINNIDKVQVNGHPQKRLPGNLSLAFAGIEGDAIILSAPEIAMSSGSACTSSSLEPSYVLTAIGLTADLARGSLRLGVGRFNTPEEMAYAGSAIVAAVQKLRKLSGPKSR